MKERKKDRDRERRGERKKSTRMIESRPCLNNWGSPSNVANFSRLGSSLPATFFSAEIFSYFFFVIFSKKKIDIFPSDTLDRYREKNREKIKESAIVDHYKNLKNSHNGGKKEKIFSQTTSTYI